MRLAVVAAGLFAAACQPRVDLRSLSAQEAMRGAGPPFEPLSLVSEVSEAEGGFDDSDACHLAPAALRELARAVAQLGLSSLTRARLVELVGGLANAVAALPNRPLYAAARICDQAGVLRAGGPLLAPVRTSLDEARTALETPGMPGAAVDCATAIDELDPTRPLRVQNDALLRALTVLSRELLRWGRGRCPCDDAQAAPRFWCPHAAGAPHAAACGAR
jgi:hypothetical protein